jgi:hypothetical protein
MNLLELSIKSSALKNVPSACPVIESLTKSVKDSFDINNYELFFRQAEKISIKNLHLKIKGIQSCLVNCEISNCPQKDNCQIYGTNCLSMRYFFDTTKDSYVIYTSDC